MRYALVVLLILASSSFSFACQNLVGEVALGAYLNEFNTKFSTLKEDEKECLLSKISEKVFIYTIKDEIARVDVQNYLDSLVQIKNYPFNNDDILFSVYTYLHANWVHAFGESIGNHSTALAKFRENPLYTKLGLLLGMGAATYYLSRKFHQEVRLVKALVTVSPRDAFWAVLASPFGRAGIASYSGLASNEFRSRRKGKFHNKSDSKEDIVQVPVSPAHFLLNEDQEELSMSYDLFSTVKDLSAIGSGSVAGLFYTYHKYGRRANIAWKNFFRSAVAKNRVTSTAALRLLARLRYSRVFMGWTPIILVGLVAEKSVNYAISSWNTYSQNSKLKQVRSDFLAALSSNEEKKKQLLPFYAEVYMNGVNEFVAFLMDNLKNRLNSHSEIYQKQRFCSSYNFIYRTYVDIPEYFNPAVARRNDFLNINKVKVSPKKEFDDISSLNKFILFRKVYDAFIENKENIVTALEVLLQAEKDFVMMEAVSDETQKKYYNQFVNRIKDLRVSLYAFNVDDVINYLIQANEDTIFLQFANEQYLSQLNSKETPFTPEQIKELTQNRYCSSSKSENKHYKNPEDVWRCYQPIAEEFGCTPVFATYKAE